MTRRITLTLVATIVLTLLTTGVATMVIAKVRAGQQTMHDLRKQIVPLVADIEDLATRGVNGKALDARAITARFRLIRRALQSDVTVVALRSGRVIGDDPPGVPVARLDAAALASGSIQTGLVGATAFAAMAAEPTTRELVVVLSRPVNTGLGAAAVWFVVAGVAVLLLGVVAASLLGRRFSRSITAAVGTAQRIATGDLAARVDPGMVQRGDELGQLGQSINAMAVALHDGRAAERTFLMNVSHDLRTPLTSIRGYADAIADGTAEPAAAAQVIRQQSMRLERLVNDLLDLARLRARTFGLDTRHVDLAAAAQTTVDGLAQQAAARGVTVSLQGQRTVVAADPDRLAQVTSNLLENALGHARTRVWVDIVPSGGHAVLTVEDDGPGLAPEDRSRVFERQYSGSAPIPGLTSGNGLGLAICQELVEAMRGRITVVAGGRAGGSAFTVALPLA